MKGNNESDKVTSSGTVEYADGLENVCRDIRHYAYEKVEELYNRNKGMVANCRITIAGFTIDFGNMKEYNGGECQEIVHKNYWSIKIPSINIKVR